MRDFKKQRGRRAQYMRMATGLAAMTALAAVAAGTASAAWGMYGKFTEAAVADAASRQELTTLEGQYDTMSKSVAELATPRGMDAAVRERYGVGRPGEGEIDIVREASSTSGEESASTGFWSGLWDALFVW